MSANDAVDGFDADPLPEEGSGSVQDPNLTEQGLDLYTVTPVLRPTLEIFATSEEEALEQAQLMVERIFMLGAAMSIPDKFDIVQKDGEG